MSLHMRYTSADSFPFLKWPVLCNFFIYLPRNGNPECSDLLNNGGAGRHPYSANPLHPESHSNPFPVLHTAAGISEVRGGWGWGFMKKKVRSHSRVSPGEGKVIYS